ncbi:MAG: helix-turn-helix transcriptional regulator [Oscillospiraceae bacterium]|nr:helix-turn-helix transcriptional regulator [Oscillospiraceae bacterium]
MYGIIESLCQDRGIKPGKMCADLGISRGIIGDLKAGRTKRLSAENIAKVSAYFGVTSDYLLGNETEKAPTENGERDILDEVDIGFYQGFKELDEADKEVLRDMVRVMRERRASRNK